MPIKLPTNLPAYEILRREGVMLMSHERAARQDIRPLRVGLLNLMPKKIQTENQFARLIGATPLQIDLHLFRMKAHQSKTATPAHMEEFYRPMDEVMASGEKFDGFIITGAPVEHLPYKEVGYWDELRRVFDWTQSHVHASFGVCWGAMAMLEHFHNVPKHDLAEKAFGCFRHDNLSPTSPYLRGFSDDPIVPVSRRTEIRQKDIDHIPSLTTLLGSPDLGPCLIEDTNHQALYILNHFEYDSDTLAQEYQRDLAEGTKTALPFNYYPGDNPVIAPKNRWKSHAHLLYGNWINEIYQSTSYEIKGIRA